MGMFLDDRYMLSLDWVHILLLCGARGIGKTYAWKKHVIKWFLEKGKKFIWARTTDTMIDSLKEGGGRKFTEDLRQNNEFSKYDWGLQINADNTIEITKDYSEEKPTWEHCGYMMSLSTFYKLKGNSYADIDTIVIDEFIAENGEVIRGDRAKQFVNTIETIGRLRKNYRVVLLSNALDKADPILNLFFSSSIIKEFGYYENKEKGALLYYSDNTAEFNTARAESISGMILKGTIYEDTISNNKFLSYDSMYYEKKPNGVAFICVLTTDTNKLSVYAGENRLYVQKYNNAKTNRFYSRNVETKIDVGTVIPDRLFKRFKELYKRNLILFDNETSRKCFVEYIK